MEAQLDLVIIGSGPAGLSAAVYAARAGLSFLVLEANYASGGQVLNTHEVDNYLGFWGIGGFELGMKFREHAEKLGTEFINKKVCALNNIEETEKEIVCEDGTVYHAKNIIVATGAVPSLLNVQGEEEYKGKGVSYCAACDGNFFKGKRAAVIGGGDTALEDAAYLARICEKVYVIHRRDAFRGAKSLEDKLYAFDNVDILWDTVVEEIQGTDVVQNLLLRNTRLNMPGNLRVDGVFVAVGTRPVSELLAGKVLTDERGYILADENCATNVAGVFAAGDVRSKNFRQIITAASDGANAVNSLIL
ncbi:MAG: thioredoxin-disulfide reductase [Alistipes sp.]|nr:thioredoxin-disulfide reductase [Alistipes sp.]